VSGAERVPDDHFVAIPAVTEGGSRSAGCRPATQQTACRQPVCATGGILNPSSCFPC
jgi:hypothetical protein